ncbi:MAG TPA: NACHT domain-containing protein, partial [Anaerolineae bacterium]|nr:NACHT domain-containing protein [Anaerolineae bacterium]
MNEGLLQTKLFVPQLRPNLVPRPRLIERLTQGLHRGRKLTLISAPAGFGKTTLVSEWVAKVERPAAWLSMDEGDNDHARFFAYFIAALQTIAPTVGEGFSRLIRSPQPPPVETMLTALVNEITTLPENIIVVLDDYHVIDAKPVDRALTFLLEQLPQQVHLVIATREDPDLQLARLRARDKLTELRAKDLRFGEAETADFLNLVMGLDISEKDVTELETRTEGWIAGLQLAALSMQGRKDKSGFIEALSGSHHFILDYLVEEILEQQPRDVQEFLLATSVLKRMTGALCDAVTGDGGSQMNLTQLDQANLFLVPLDDERRWYRYHHLFAELLQSILRQQKPVEEIRELHRRAGRWHRGEGNLEEAMIHTMAAQDFEQAALMIEENFASMFSRSEVPVLLGWIEKLPQEIIRDHPWINIYRANTLALASQLDDVDSLLAGVEERIELDDPQSSALLGHIAAIHAFTANLRGDATRSLEMATLAEKRLPEDFSAARGMAAYALADTTLAGDEIDRASQKLLEMVRFGQDARQLMVIVPALCDLAYIRKVQGQLHQAKELYDRAYHWMMEQKGLDSRVRCPYEFGLADLLRERNQVDAAYEHAMTGIEYRQRLGGYLVVGDLVLMRVLQAHGDVEGAMKSLRNAEAFMQTYNFQLSVGIEFKTARVVQWLVVGEVETASR